MDPNNAIFEADETNNSAHSSTVVATGIDLTIVKDDSPPKSPLGFDPIATAGTQTYIITVDNIGPQGATNIACPRHAARRDDVPHRPGRLRLHLLARQRHRRLRRRLPARHVEEFYAGAGEHRATITIRIFAQPIVGTMHNEVRVDPLNQIAEINETNNIDFEDTDGPDRRRRHGRLQRVHHHEDADQAAPVGTAVARNAKVTYAITVEEQRHRSRDRRQGARLPARGRALHRGHRHQPVPVHGGRHFVECVGGQIGRPAARRTATITITMFAPDTPGTYTNQAIVDPDEHDPRRQRVQQPGQRADHRGRTAATAPSTTCTIAKTGATTTVPGGAISYT